MKNFKRYKIQLIVCAAMSVMAAAAAFIGGLVCDEMTAVAVKLYCVVHPAAIVVAIALETLFLVSPVMMAETNPDVFFRCGTETSIIAAAFCEIVIITTERQEELIATITMLYILLTLTAFVVCLTATRVIKK